MPGRVVRGEGDPFFPLETNRKNSPPVGAKELATVVGRVLHNTSTVETRWEREVLPSGKAVTFVGAGF